MFDNALREIKDAVLVPVADRAGARLSPTVVSVVGLGFGLLSAGAALVGAYAAALLLWGVNRFLDGLDGTIARRHDKQSAMGGYLDTLLDHVVYTAIPVALALSDGGRGALLACIWLLATFYVNGASWMMLSAILERHTTGEATLTTVKMPNGIIEGGETVAFYTAFLLFPAHIVPLFATMGALVVVTIIGRLIWAFRHL
ncbi:MAG: CDP-alcohol phosphatidyltransferase family protein [Anaerolineaceae bacterium]|nr:MAG: CDP-alcohol phosphatidyltransferase family protein [Anaerolineaceae bacterium]